MPRCLMLRDRLVDAHYLQKLELRKKRSSPLKDQTPWTLRVRAEVVQLLGVPCTRGSKGASGSKNELKTETTNECWKNIYRRKHELAIRYRESKIES